MASRTAATDVSRRDALKAVVYPRGFKTPVETTAGFGPDFMDSVQIALRN